MRNNPSTPKENPFIRFKNHVNHHISTGLQSLLGIPSTISQTFAAGPAKSQTPTPETNTAEPETADPTIAKMSGDDADYPGLDHPPPRLEASLDALRGGTRTESLLAWRLFLTHSSYSPLLLDHSLPCRPTPNGLPSRSDPALYSSWADAFEDLLLAASGKPMVDLRERPARRALWIVARWGPEGYLRRLRRERLDEVYFPFHDDKKGYVSPGTREEWVAARKQEAAVDEERRRRWETIWRERSEEVQEVQEVQGGEEEEGRKLEEVAKGDEEGRLGEVVGEVVGMMRELDKVVREGLGTGREENPDTQNTEEDLYADIQSALAGGENSLSNLFKSMEDEREKERREAQGKGHQDWTTEFKDGSTKTVTRNEYIDEMGAAHIKEVVSFKDPKGVEVSRSVRHSIRAVHEDSKGTAIDTSEDAKQDPNQTENGELRNGKDSKKSGWFWSP